MLARRDGAQGLVILPARNDAVTAYPVYLVVWEGGERPVDDNDARPCFRLLSNIYERSAVLLQVVIPARNQIFRKSTALQAEAQPTHLSAKTTSPFVRSLATSASKCLAAFFALTSSD